MFSSLQALIVPFLGLCSSSLGAFYVARYFGRFPDVNWDRQKRSGNSAYLDEPSFGSSAARFKANPLRRSVHGNEIEMPGFVSISHHFVTPRQPAAVPKYFGDR